MGNIFKDPREREREKKKLNPRAKDIFMYLFIYFGTVILALSSSEDDSK